MTETREFPLADVLSVVTGRNIGHNGMTGTFACMDFLLGADGFLGPVVAAENREWVADVLVQRHAFLGSLTVPPADDYQSWLAAAEAEHGASVAIWPVP